MTTGVYLRRARKWPITCWSVAGWMRSACCALKAMPSVSRRTPPIRMRLKTVASTSSSSPTHEETGNALFAGTCCEPAAGKRGSGFLCSDTSSGRATQSAGSRAVQARSFAAHVAGPAGLGKARSSGHAQQASHFR